MKRYRVLKRGETIERWHQVGVGCQELQQAAMDYPHTNNTSSRSYCDAWASLADVCARLRGIDKSARSHAWGRRFMCGVKFAMHAARID